MQKIFYHVKSKGMAVIMPVLILAVLLSIYIFNSMQKNDSAVVYAENGTFIEASGTVKGNGVSVSSEVTGTVESIYVHEGEAVRAGETLAQISSTNLKNQYEQSLINLQLTEKNVELLTSNIEYFRIQNEDMISQSKSAYESSQSEYSKIMSGASDDEIKLAEESVKQAKANMEYAKSSLDRTISLLDQDAISRAKYDEAQKNYDVAVAQYNSAVSQLGIVNSYPEEDTAQAAKNKMLQAKSGYELSVSSGNTQLYQLESQLEIAIIQLEQSRKNVEQARIELDKTVIKSPADGVVNSLLVNIGEFVSTGKLIAEIYGKSHEEIKSYVSEQNIGYIKAGQEAEIYVDSDSTKPLMGKVIRINDEAEFTPKNIQTKEERVNTVFEVTIEVMDSDGTVKPGMPVDVKIKID